MFFSLKELIRWLGLTVFEIWMHLIAISLFSMLAVLKYESVISLSWWVVFIPLFTCDGVSAYFCIIVFIRMYKDLDFRAAGVRFISSLLSLTLLFVFKILLCQKLDRSRLITCAEVLSPLFILLQIILIRACQVQWNRTEILIMINHDNLIKILILLWSSIHKKILILIYCVFISVLPYQCLLNQYKEH